jgi:hypothetical protein
MITPKSSIINVPKLNLNNKEEEYMKHKCILKASWPHVIDNEQKAELINEFTHAIATECDEHTCAVCGRQRDIEAFNRHSDSDLSIETMDVESFKTKYKQKLMRHGCYLLTELDAQFEYGAPFESLNNYMLDKDGLCYVSGQIKVCKECSTFSGKKKKGPKFSLSNGLWSGKCPEVLKNLTYIEEMVISLVRVRKCIVKVNAEKTDTMKLHSKLHGHIICFPQNPSEVYNILPCSVGELSDIISIVFIGPKGDYQAYTE